MANKVDPTKVILSDSKTGKIPSSQGDLILQEVIENSVIMGLGKYEDMRDAEGNPVMEKEFTFLADGPGAYWVDEGEKIKTSKASWVTAKLTAKKLGVIIPCSKEYLKFTVQDFFEQMKPKIAEAFYKKFDEAGILGVANPFTQSIEKAITTSKTAVAGDINHANILAIEDLIFNADIEPNAFISKSQNNSLLRAAVSANGEILYDKANKTLDGSPVINLKSAEMKKGNLYIGNFDYLYYGIPWEIEYDISEQAQLSTIVNDDSTPVNLWEQDLIALKATMHLGLMIVKEDAFAKIAPPAEPPEGA